VTAASRVCAVQRYGDGDADRVRSGCVGCYFHHCGLYSPFNGILEISPVAVRDALNSWARNDNLTLHCQRETPLRSPDEAKCHSAMVMSDFTKSNATDESVRLQSEIDADSSITEGPSQA
jgi:hypothetical protein